MFLGSCSTYSSIDFGISSAVKESSKLSMTKSIFDGKIETTIPTEIDTGFKRNSVDLWPKYGYFKSQAYYFSLEKANMPEITIFYINQASLSYKDNKKIYYADVHMLGQVVPVLNPPEDLENYVPKSNEAKLIRPKYDPASGEFLGLVQTLAYLTIRGENQECFFDYGYSKENSKVLYSTHRMKIPNRFSSTIFNRHRIQFKTEALSETEFSKVFFFLPSTTDRVEEINRYINSVNLVPIDIEISECAETFDPSKLDYANDEKEKHR